MLDILNFRYEELKKCCFRLLSFWLKRDLSISMSSICFKKVISSVCFFSLGPESALTYGKQTRYRDAMVHLTNLGWSTLEPLVVQMTDTRWSTVPA